eukprot:7319403-Lingulodinium_polyedra.AAC.1
MAAHGGLMAGSWRAHGGLTVGSWRAHGGRMAAHGGLMAAHGGLKAGSWHGWQAESLTVHFASTLSQL